LAKPNKVFQDKLDYRTGPITRYTYDANGNFTQVQDARGNSTTYEYDTLNRLTKASIGWVKRWLNPTIFR
jgi:YD repeat-containing protein